MRCPVCQHLENRVLESRSADSGQSVRRRRECLKCGHRFTTYERIEVTPIMVIKRSGQRELFDQSKLFQGILKACEKSGVADQDLQTLVNHVETDLQQRSIREVTSLEIGELVLKYLQPISEVAYIRFASVYSQFQSLEDFLAVLDHLRPAVKPMSGALDGVSLNDNSLPC
ncbi:MAG: transcriptional regulator NrdR, partial [Synechococcales bacterium]|nr:transcriptional regulator NrdR [Synechococcales bacterium]